MPGDMYDCIPSRSTPALRARSPLRIPCRLPGHNSLASFVGRSAGQRWRPLQARVGDELVITTKASAQTAVDMMVWNMTCDGKSGIGVGGVPNLQRHCSYLQMRGLLTLCAKRIAAQLGAAHHIATHYIHTCSTLTPIYNALAPICKCGAY